MRTDTKITHRGRGRPRKFDEGQVLKGAMERFRTLGYSNTSLDDLAEATGVNRPSLYAAFGDKKALYLAGLARTHAGVDATFAALHAAAYPPEKMLKALFLGALEGFLTGEDGPSGCIAVNTAATEAVTDPDIRAALAAFVALQDGWIEKLMVQAGSTDPRGDAQIASSVIHSLSTRARAGTPRAELIAIAKKATALLLG
ncbi:TetR/AcrR family transcriptional regulator [Sphingomonas sp. HITSZ_GF]|uniref:TetR/AcrR family transcriptional regulator n=1 Tax=Sphingomonas sp. HITSZ_GF TaxID=3037247 RepID=UPI00240E1067|nr:TetR/AcrR family transcriptional regulator [Sphingomonas sp. HITSZ_GF]MDG2533569.1 TetR/AcrR family transcriptional regulator [Sphingomonas sp. HITSZ_GF]